MARECCHQVRYSTGVVLLDRSDSNLTVDESSDGLAIMSSLPPAGRVGRVIGMQQPPLVCRSTPRADKRTGCLRESLNAEKMRCLLR